MECDISSRESVGAFADAVRERFGRCDVLVASAGIYPVIPFAELEWEDWRRILAVNVDSLFHLSKAFVPGMIENGWGRVIAVSSTTFHTGTPQFVAYTTSKGGVIGFVRALATEVGDAGVTVNSVAPSLVRTKGTEAGPQGPLGWFDFTPRAAGDQAHAAARGPRRRDLVLRLRRLRLHHGPDAARRRRAHPRLSRQPQISSAVSTTRRSFAVWSS